MVVLIKNSLERGLKACRCFLMSVDMVLLKLCFWQSNFHASRGTEGGLGWGGGLGCPKGVFFFARFFFSEFCKHRRFDQTVGS
jgi:hypothetical protein